MQYKLNLFFINNEKGEIHMTDNEIIKRLLEEHFELKEKLRQTENAFRYWYNKANDVDEFESSEKSGDTKVMENV